MRRLLWVSVTGLVFALFSRAVLATSLQDMQAIFVKWSAYMFLLFGIVVALLVYFLRPREDKRAAPLNRISKGREAVHSVGPDTVVMACVRTMAAKKIGALIVMDGESLIGIFTERDALNKVLAAGLDPRTTKVSEVMTKDPCCVPPTLTVSAAMELISQRRFRHLPIVEHDKVVGLVSSGDLTHWLVKDHMDAAREYVPLAARLP